MSNKFDIVIIVSGNGGFGVYAIAAEAGKSIAFVESLDFGGTCPNRGCTPKKVLVAAAQSLETIANASVHGIDVGPRLLPRIEEDAVDVLKAEAERIGITV